MLRSALRERVLQQVNDVLPTHWSTSQINDTIDDSLQFVAEQARPFKSSIQLPLRAGKGFYFTSGLGPEVMAPYRVYLVSDNRRLTASTLLELDELMFDWTTTSSTGNPWIWIPISWDCFMIWPVPSAAGGILQVDCLMWPRPMQDDNDELEINESDVEAVIDYTVFDALLKRFDVDAAKAHASRMEHSFANLQAIHGGEKIFSKMYTRLALNLPMGLPRRE